MPIWEVVAALLSVNVPTWRDLRFLAARVGSAALAAAVLYFSDRIGISGDDAPLLAVGVLMVPAVTAWIVINRQKRTRE